jgi:hypothetical protein
MNSITALKYAQAIQADRERRFARRPEPTVERDRAPRPQRRTQGGFARWFRFPRPASTNA